MQLVSFVIPCYRSSSTIRSVVDEVRSAIAALPQYDHEIILVNDCSPDDTLSVLRELAEEDERITVVDLARNFGQPSAVMAGMRHSVGDIVVTLDDDGQTPADEVDKLLSKLQEGYDVVYASYEHKQHSAFRKLGTKVNNLMTEILLNKPKDLSITSYQAMRRFIVDEMLRYTQCFPYVDGLVLRSTRRVCNVPVEHRKREQGESGYSFGKLLSLWMNGFTAFSVKPLRLASIVGALAALAGFIYTIVIIVKHFVDSAIPAGWSSSMALQLIIGGLVLLVLGLIGEYIGRIYMCINASPQYIEREVIKKGGKAGEL